MASCLDDGPGVMGVAVLPLGLVCQRLVVTQSKGAIEEAEQLARLWVALRPSLASLERSARRASVQGLVRELAAVEET